eukprot:s47_g27.t1
MKLATLENFDKIHEEVAKVMEQELEKCGSLQATIQAEHDKGWEQVKLRMEQLQAAKQKLQEQKKLAKERAEAFVQELEGAVASAEAAASVLKEAVDSLIEAQEKEKLKPDQVIMIPVSQAAQVSKVCRGHVGESQLVFARQFEDAKWILHLFRPSLKEKKGWASGWPW